VPIGPTDQRAHSTTYVRLCPCDVVVVVPNVVHACQHPELVSPTAELLQMQPRSSRRQPMMLLTRSCGENGGVECVPNTMKATQTPPRTMDITVGTVLSNGNQLGAVAASDKAAKE
jgi:hypothetical protein